MAKSSNPFDMAGLYRAGYSSVYDPTKDKSERVNAINTILGFALEQTGRWAVQRYRDNYEELKELKAMGRASKTAVQMEMNKIGGVLSPQMMAALTQFKKEYDKGARMSVKGFGRKRKEKGQEMMDLAYQKMTMLSQHLKLVQGEMQTQVDNGMAELGEKPEGSERPGWTDGATESQLTNSVSLATGKMLQNLEVDLNTGEIYHLKQKIFEGSEDDYNAYVEGVGGSGEGVLSQEEWVQLNQEDMDIEKTIFTKMDWASESDHSVGTTLDPMYDTAEKMGKKGDAINEYDVQSWTRKLRGVFRDSSDNAIRTFMFGGELSVMVDGKLQVVSPAVKYLMDRGYKPGDSNAPEGSEELRQYYEFQGALTDLREEDYSKGSKFRDMLLDMSRESIMAYQQNGLNEYSSKQEVIDNKSNVSSSSKADKIQYKQGMHAEPKTIDRKVEQLQKIIDNKKGVWLDFAGNEWTYDNGNFKAVEGYDENNKPVYRVYSPTSLLEYAMPMASFNYTLNIENPLEVTEEEIKSDSSTGDYPTVRGKEMDKRQKKYHDKMMQKGWIWDPKTESYRKPTK